MRLVAPFVITHFSYQPQRYEKNRKTTRNLMSSWLKMQKTPKTPTIWMANSAKNAQAANSAKIAQAANSAKNVQAEP
jgi:hypothetical protein